jgi:asparagine synthase (glutamine-hydrolysing)
MCGLTGFMTRSGLTQAAGTQLLATMADAITHRGPDDFGAWVDEQAGVGFAHRRLAILDLSAAGHQPMRSPSGRYMLAFNGEIYNHLELRDRVCEQIGQIQWRGHSDTETLLTCIEAWGLDATLQLCIGMFAIAVWDHAEQRLSLARDRLGEKPLYYGWQGQGESRVFLFGSELKALRRHPAFEAPVDRQSITLLMRHNYVPAPKTIFEGIYKLAAASILMVEADGSQSERQYWSGIEVARSGLATPFAGSASESVEQLDSLLQDAVGKQMAADVPLGAFLSGGIDSSTIVALMQKQSARPIKTFTIGFDETQFNEAEHAAAVAKHLGTEHTELYVSPQQALDVIPRLGHIYDEPFADSSQIPTFLLSEMTRQHVTVSLSGDAGDELFCGYNRYTAFAKTYSKLSRVPSPIRHLGAKAIRAVPPGQWDSLTRQILPMLPKRLRMANIGDKLHKAAGILAATTPGQYYLGLISHTMAPEDLVENGQEPPTLARTADDALSGIPDIERMMLLDMLTYLPDDILVKVDRAAMSNSLETRVPFLDHRVVEFAWSLPLNYKLRDGQGKWALRQVLYKYVPRELIERPKTGFGIPLAEWLRGPLKDWAESLLDEKQLRQQGYFRVAAVRQKWEEHLSGQRNWGYQLWDILMFQNWLDAQ